MLLIEFWKLTVPWTETCEGLRFIRKCAFLMGDVPVRKWEGRTGHRYELVCNVALTEAGAGMVFQRCPKLNEVAGHCSSSLAARVGRTLEEDPCSYIPSS